MPGNPWFYPNDPYKTLVRELGNQGGLTNDGKMSAYNLGQFLKSRYGEFLGPYYSKDNIQIRADAVDRTIMSGQLVAAALFPPYKQQRWNPDLDWQPIPVWMLPTAEDNLNNALFCNNYKKWRNNVETTDKQIMRFEEENRDVYKYLSEKTGYNITQSLVLSLRQVLYSERDIGLTLPQWTKSVFPDGKLDDLAAYDTVIQTRTPELKQLFGGTWLHEWLTHIDNYLNNTDSRTAFLYPAHEITLSTVLATLDNYDYQVPSYSSSLMFELHKEEDNQYYVKLLYRNQGSIRVLQFSECDDGMCPLNVFKKFVQPLISKDRGKLCGGVN